MPTINVKIAAGADDGFAKLNNHLFSTGDYTSYKLILGNFIGSSATRYSNIGALRFQNIAIAQGSTVSSAALSMIKKGSNIGTPTITVYGDNVDNAAAWGASNRVNNITKTSQSASLDVTNPTSSTDVTSIVQAIINRAGWLSGNAMAFGGFPTNTAGANYWIGYAYEKGGADIPALSITYSGVTPSANGNFLALF